MNNNILNTIKQGEQDLINSGIDSQSAKLEAGILLSYVLTKPKSYILTWPDQLLKLGQLAM